MRAALAVALYLAQVISDLDIDLETPHQQQDDQHHDDEPDQPGRPVAVGMQPHTGQPAQAQDHKQNDDDQGDGHLTLHAVQAAPLNGLVAR